MAPYKDEPTGMRTKLVLLTLSSIEAQERGSLVLAASAQASPLSIEAHERATAGCSCDGF